MERRSLMEGLEKPDKDRAKHRSSAGMSKSNADKVKLTLALSLFVIAIGLIAWYADLLPFGKEPPPPPPTAEQVQQIKKRDVENKKLQEAGKIQNAGSE